MKKYKSINTITEEFLNGKNGINFNEIENEDKTLYNWKCIECEEVWQTTKYQRIIAKKGDCYYCTGQKVRRNESLGKLYPKLEKEWSNDNLKSIFDYSAKNRDEVTWICEKCKEPYKRRIHSRVNGKGCPCSESILIQYPEIAKELVEGNPKYITKGSKKIFKWKCLNPNCNHIWEDSVNKRINGKTKCPICSKKIAKDGNCLADTHRHLMYEWDFENNSISPFAITSKNSTIEVQWKCKKYPDLHRWTTEISYRISKKPTGCPYCAGVKTSILESIVTTHSELAKEFNKEKNEIDIENVRAGSQKQIWWKCSNKDCGYEWLATPANRTGKNKTGCKECSSKLNKSGESKLEKTIRLKLSKIFKSLEERPKTTNLSFDKGQRIDIDIFINDLNLAFDIDPYYTHKNSIITDTKKSNKLMNYANFFKFREYPLEKTSENDVIYFNIEKDINQLLVDKIFDLYPNLNKELKRKLADFAALRSL